MCFSDFSFRNTFGVSMVKTLWKSQNVSRNGFFQGKHHLAPAVVREMELYSGWNNIQWSNYPVPLQCHHQYLPGHQYCYGTTLSSPIDFSCSGFRDTFLECHPALIVSWSMLGHVLSIKGRLRRSLQWWPPYHCSVPPLPPATFVRLISELCQNTSSTPIPPPKPAFLSLSLPTSTMCYLPQHNQSPTMLHTRSMFQANHIAHTPVLEVMSHGHHKDLRGFMSASFGTIWNTSLLIICSFYYHMLFMLTPYMFMFCFSINTPVCCMYFTSLNINLATYFSLTRSRLS